MSVQHLHKVVDCFHVRKIIIVDIDAQAEKEPCVSPVYNLVLPKFNKVGVLFASD